MAMTRWEPFREAQTLQNVFEKFFQEGAQGTGPKLALNAYETEEGLVFEAALPGARKDSFEINYKDQFLTIKASLSEEKTTEGTRYHLKEIVRGRPRQLAHVLRPVVGAIEPAISVVGRIEKYAFPWRFIWCGVQAQKKKYMESKLICPLSTWAN